MPLLIRTGSGSLADNDDSSTRRPLPEDKDFEGGPADCVASSLREFQPPQSLHFPAHFVWTAPQDWQTYLTEARAT